MCGTCVNLHKCCIGCIWTGKLKLIFLFVDFEMKIKLLFCLFYSSWNQEMFI